jgi:hypothetical protein
MISGWPTTVQSGFNSQTLGRIECVPLTHRFFKALLTSMPISLRAVEIQVSNDRGLPLAFRSPLFCMMVRIVVHSDVRSRGASRPRADTLSNDEMWIFGFDRSP